jgi:hypothetical protein
MITFTAAADRELLSELKEAGLVTPIVLEAIHSTLAEAENPALNDFLLAGAEWIDEREWLTWLIRHHACYRFGPVRLTKGFRVSEAGLDRAGPNLPYAALPVPQEGEPGWLVGVLRPDLPVLGLRAAATLLELRELKAGWHALPPTRWA